MKMSAALQILTTVMSGTPASDGDSGNHWTSLDNVHQQDFLTQRADLDLGACLDVETLDDFTDHMYEDGGCHAAPAGNAWLDNVISMTSSGELISSDDHALRVVPRSSSAGFPLAGCLPDGLHLASDVADDTDNAVFNPLQAPTSAVVEEEVSVIDGASEIVDFAQFGSFNSVSPSNAASATTLMTIDLAALEQFVTREDDHADLRRSLEEAPEEFSTISSHIPSSLWSWDLRLPTAASEESQPSGSSSGVKESLKNCLYSRGSMHSLSLDDDVTATCSSSTRSLSSPTSSLTQSFEDDEADDPQKAVEKREKNRLAAQKCRNKKRQKEDSLQKTVGRLEERQERLKEEVQKLRDQRETLEEIINIHGIVCPKLRKVSNS